MGCSTAVHGGTAPALSFCCPSGFFAAGHQAWHVFDTGTRSPWLQLCVYIMDAVSMALFWATLMLLAQGDQMGNPAPLNVSERRSVHERVLANSASREQLLAGFLFLILTVVVMLNVRLVFIWIAQSHELLLMQLAALQQGPGEREAECPTEHARQAQRDVPAHDDRLHHARDSGAGRGNVLTEKHYTESTVIYAALRELVDGLVVVVGVLPPATGSSGVSRRANARGGG